MIKELTEKVILILVLNVVEKSICVYIDLDDAKYRLKLIIRNLENIQKEIYNTEVMMHVICVKHVTQDIF